MSAWLSVVLLSALLGCSAALPRLSKDVAKELDGLLADLLNKYEASSDTLNGHEDDRAHHEFDSGYSNLFGLAHLGNKIFVVEDENNVIQVYDDDTFSLVDRITVKDLKYPGDLTACRKSGKLFLYEQDPNNILWKIDPVTHAATKLIFDEGNDLDPIQTLSASNGHVILTTKFTNELLVVDSYSGNVLKNIRLPRTIVARHAVETAGGTFIVANVGSRGSSTNDGVTEIDDNGNILKAYSGKRGSGSNQMNKPSYLALAPDGSVYVADFENRRVVHVNAGLSSMEVSLTTEDLLSRQGGDSGDKTGRPWRLSINENGNKLLVGLATGEVALYTI